MLRAFFSSSYKQLEKLVKDALWRVHMKGRCDLSASISPAAAVVVREIAALDHETGDDSVEAALGVAHLA